MFPLISMDPRMPVMDGLDASCKIEQLPGGMDIPILAMIANAFVENKQCCLESGMTRPYRNGRRTIPTPEGSLHDLSAIELK